MKGTPGDWGEQLAQLALDEGISVFLLATDDPDHLRRFAEEVRPRVVQLVAAARGPASSP